MMAKLSGEISKCFGRLGARSERARLVRKSVAEASVLNVERWTQVGRRCLDVWGREETDQFERRWKARRRVWPLGVFMGPGGQ